MKKRLSIVFAVLMAVAVFTVMFAAMALPVSAATEAGDDDVVATVYWHTEDDFAGVPAENKIEVTKAEMLTKLLAGSNDNVTKAKAEAGNYIWVVFATDKQISLERNGEGIGFYVAKDKKLTIEGNGAVYRFNMDNYDNGSNATVIKCVGTGTNPGTVVFNDFTVNSKNDAALNPAGCTVELNNTVLNSSRHKGLFVTAGNAELILDGVSRIYGSQQDVFLHANNQLTITGTIIPVSGGQFRMATGATAGKLTLDNVTMNGTVYMLSHKGTLEIKDSTLTGPSGDKALWIKAMDAASKVIISGTTRLTGGEDGIVLAGDTATTLTIKDSAYIAPTRFAVRMQKENTVVNVQGGTITTAQDSFMRFEASNITLNISGENTLLECTGENKCVINTNGNSDATKANNETINISGGATVKANGIAIYANGGTYLDIDMDGANIECADPQGRGAILRYSASATDTTDIKNSTLTGGLSGIAGTLTIDNSSINTGFAGHAITFSGTTLDITNGSTITAGENKYTIKINSAAEVTIDGGSVVTSASVGDRVSDTKTVGHILFGTNGITLNISGEGTIVEGTSTASVSNAAGGVIDINRMSNATINIEDGATLRSKATTCIYNLGAAGTKVYINISGDDTLIQAGENGNKMAVLMRGEFATEGLFDMTGGTVNGTISIANSSTGSTKMNISITGGEINGQLNFQQNENFNKAIFKDVTITYVASGGSNTIDLGNMPADFENVTINASSGYHAITARSTVNLKNTTITCTGTTIAVRAIASNDVSSANIHIYGDCVFTGDKRGGAWTDSGTLEINSGATVTIDAGAVISATSGTTIGVKTGGQVYSEGDISNETGMALVIFGYAEFTGGSITTGTTPLDIPALVAEGGEIGAFENVAVTGTLIAAEGTVVGNGGVVTLGGDKLVISGGNVSSIIADSVEITGGTIASANIADGAVILTNATVGSMMRSAAAGSIVADASGATFNGVTAEAIGISGITATLNNVTAQALAVGDEADVTATNSVFAAESADALISVAGASTVTLNNTKVNNTGNGVAIAVADTAANEINVNNSQLNANSTVISAKDGENAQTATLNLNNAKLFANEGTPIEGEATLSFYVAAVKNPANAGAAEGQVEIDGVIYNIYTGAQGGVMTATDGASIRISTGSNGLRFTSVLTTKTIDYINSIATDPESVEFGTAVFPTHLIAEAGLSTFDVPALKALGYTVLEIPAVDAMNNRILGADEIEVVGYTINAAITNIKDEHLDWEYSAITYIKYTDATGEHVIYGSYNEENNSRSIIYIANMAYNDVKAPEDEGYDSSYAYPVGGGKYSPYTATQRATIKAIIDKYEALNP